MDESGSRSTLILKRMRMQWTGLRGPSTDNGPYPIHIFLDPQHFFGEKKIVQLRIYDNAVAEFEEKLFKNAVYAWGSFHRRTFF